MLQPISLEDHKSAFDKALAQYKTRIIICAGTGCLAGGALRIHDRLLEIIAERGLPIAVSLKKEPADYLLSASGCQGFCQMGPLLTIEPLGILYTKVQMEDVQEIVDETILNGRLVQRLLYTSPEDGETVARREDIPFYAKQLRLLLKACGNVDARDLSEYISNGGYFMARKTLLDMTPEDICAEMLKSGLRGRGGGGFPTGRKWDLTRLQKNDLKYVICNGDEGDPGAFMDRCLMEGAPHSVLEGMLIAGKAVGAKEGRIYVRTEYPLAVQRLKEAINDAQSQGLLGENIFNSGFDFHIEVTEGAGAFVCGEETALIASIEGRRGMPNPKPPFPAQKGLFGRPTVINNVETLASVPLILRLGAENYARLGTESSKGTKTFALTGHVANTGLIEVPFGVTLREIVHAIGGGVLNDAGEVDGRDFKAVQIGGPSGGCLTMDHLDLPLDYENLQTVGAMVGSGGLVVMNEDTCMVKIAHFFMRFTQNESCGKCVLCREGTRQMLALLEDIIEGRATAQTIPLLEELAHTVKLGSLCGLGKTAPNPVLSTLRYFRAEYEAHVQAKHCPAGQCDAFKQYAINLEKCKRCGLCAKKCPAEAISGSRETPYAINPAKCIKCDACLAACKFQAVIRAA